LWLQEVVVQGLTADILLQQEPVELDLFVILHGDMVVDLVEDVLRVLQGVVPVERHHHMEPVALEVDYQVVEELPDQAQVY
jgi:hypothetical protein